MNIQQKFAFDLIWPNKWSCNLRNDKLKENTKYTADYRV